VVVPADTRCFDAYRAGPNHAFCVSRGGAVFHFDGSTWTRTAHDPFGATLAPEDWGRFPPELWAGDATLAWGTGPTHVFRSRPEPTGDQFGTVVNVLEHYDGETWTELARGYFFDITGSAPDDVWIAGDKLLHYDGRSLAPVTPPPELSDATFTAIHSFGPRSVWFVAQRHLDSTSLLVRYDGAWSIERMGSTSGMEGIEFDDIAGTSEDELWLIATRNPVSRFLGTGILYRREGASWRPIELWGTWGFRQLTIDGDRLLLSDTGGLYELPMATISTATVISEPPPALGSPIGPAQLWIGPTDLWMTNAEQAVHLPR